MKDIGSIVAPGMHIKTVDSCSGRKSGLKSHDPCLHPFSGSEEVKGGRTSCKIIKKKNLNDLGGVHMGGGCLYGSGRNKTCKGGAGWKLKKAGTLEPHQDHVGSLPMAHNGIGGSYVSGRSSEYYGDHKEESNIQRNNGRQWKFLNRDVGDKLLAAIIALGVVDAEGRNKILSRIVDLERERSTEEEGRKENFKVVQ